jgi:hypothetical protein
MTISHDLKLKTALPYTKVEHLLSTCCSKRYSMTLDDIEETENGPRKVIRITFEDPADREQFRNTFQQARGESAHPKEPEPRIASDRRRRSTQ